MLPFLTQADLKYKWCNKRNFFFSSTELHKSKVSNISLCDFVIIVHTAVQLVNLKKKKFPFLTELEKRISHIMSVLIAVTLPQYSKFLNVTSYNQSETKNKTSMKSAWTERFPFAPPCPGISDPPCPGISDETPRSGREHLNKKAKAGLVCKEVNVLFHRKQTKKEKRG